MKNEVPWCHGEKMIPTYRYKEKGVIYRTFTCNAPGCQHTEEVEWE
jgi:hypothetical protein